MADDAGHFGTTAPDGTVHADVWSAREDFYVLFRDPKTGAFCILDTMDPNFGKTKLEFSDFPKDSLPVKAWSRAEAPKTFSKDLKNGKEHQWIYVDLNATKVETDRFYVSPEIKSDPKSGYPFTSVMIVNEQRLSVSIFPSKKKFSAVTTDFLAMPSGTEDNFDMKPGDLSEAVLKFMRSPSVVSTKTEPSWPKWTMRFSGEGWLVRDVKDGELIKIAENQRKDVGIFISGKDFKGDVTELLASLKLADPKSKDLYHLATIGGLRAVQIFTSMKKDGQVISVWGLMFVKEGKIIALQGLYKNDDGKALLTQVMTTFQFTDK